MQSGNLSDLILGYKLTEAIKVDEQIIYPKGTVIDSTIISRLQDMGISTCDIESILYNAGDADNGEFIRICEGVIPSDIRSKLKVCDAAHLFVYAKLIVDSYLHSDFVQSVFEKHIIDMETRTHSINVATLCVAYGLRMKMSNSMLHDLAVGALLHDIGKSRLDQNILNKRARLTGVEFREIQLHPGLGLGLVLGNLSISKNSKDCIIQHHENWDGTGYPQHLVGTEVNPLARVVHIADSFEAISAQRKYKDAIPRFIVKDIISRDAGSKYDPTILRKFLEYTPSYLLGDEVPINGKIAVVVNNDDMANPVVSYNEEIMCLSKFKEIVGEEGE